MSLLVIQISPNSGKIRYINLFQDANTLQACKIYHDVYGEDILPKSTIRKTFTRFCSKKFDLEDTPHSARHRRKSKKRKKRRPAQNQTVVNHFHIIISSVLGSKYIKAKKYLINVPFFYHLRGIVFEFKIFKSWPKTVSKFRRCRLRLKLFQRKPILRGSPSWK